MKNYLIFFTILSLYLSLCAQTSRVLLEEQWGRHFNPRIAESGEVLTINSVFSDNLVIYLYDIAERRIVTFDSTGSFIKITALSSIGRHTYVGDDFVVLNNDAIFLNTIDKTLEIFDLNSGKHTLSVFYPYDYFANESKRSHRIINRIYLDGEVVTLATARKLFYFDYRSKKVLVNKKIISPGSGGRFLFYDGKTIVELSDDRIVINNSKNFPTVVSRYPLSGKQYFMKNDALYALILNTSGFRIIEVND